MERPKCRPETYASGVQCAECGRFWGHHRPEECPLDEAGGNGFCGKCLYDKADCYCTPKPRQQPPQHEDDGMKNPVESVFLTWEGGLPIGYYPKSELFEYAPKAPLLARIERLEAALQEIADNDNGRMGHAAHRALAKEPTE